MQKRKISGLIVAFIILLLTSYILGTSYVAYMEYVNETVHGTGRWAVIQDVTGRRLSVEPTSDAVWRQLLELHQNGTRKWIGGIVEPYHNKWGFRFQPDTIIIADVTAEGLQATIQYLSENLGYWLTLRWAYIGAIVIELHQ